MTQLGRMIVWTLVLSALFLAVAYGLQATINLPVQVSLVVLAILVVRSIARSRRG